MEGKFTHYLITRYNVHLDTWDQDQSGASTRDAEWMKHRESLFKRYCFPSVIAQSNTRFRWLLYFQTGTPEAWIQPIIEMIRPYPHIEARMVDRYHGCMHDIDERLRHASTPFIITSRLDNDDGLAIRYIEYIQSHFVPEPNTLINLTEGVGYQPDRKVGTRLRGMKLNHFSSYIEAHRPEGGHTSVRGFQHGAPPVNCHVINVTTAPAWIKIFHNRNLKSTPFGYPVWTTHFRSCFGIGAEQLRIRLIATLTYSVTWLCKGIYRKIIRPLWT